MGLEPVYLDYIGECVAATLGDLAGLRMLELGDQVIEHASIPESTGKAYFEKRGVAHTSFDLNGQHGALVVDLSKPITDPRWLGSFDVVTNSGTSEHVEPREAQYMCFKNVHDCLRPGGIAVHLVPDVAELDRAGLWKGHCQHYYSEEFFSLLARCNGYETVSTKLVNGLRCACLRKVGDAPFTGEREAIVRAVARREWPAEPPQAPPSPRRTRSPLRRFLRALDPTRRIRKRRAR